MNWLVRPAKKDNESPSGYLFRLAEANGYASLKRWKYACSHNDENRPRLDDENTVDSRYTLTAFQRVCPDCIREDSYLRAAWDHALTITCLSHETALETHCPNCRKVLRRGPGLVEACSCGYAYVDIPTRKRSPQVIEYLLADKLKYWPTATQYENLSHLAHLSEDELIQLIMLFGTFGNFPSLRKPRKVPLKEGSENTQKILCQANEVLDDWPANFYLLLSKTYSRHPTNSTLRNVFGYFYSALYKDLAGPCFDFVRSAFEDWLRRNWKGQLTERHRRLTSNTRSNKKVKSITAISKESGVSHALLADLVERGEILGSVRTLPSGRKSTMIELYQDGRINELTTRYDLLAASREMAIPAKRLRSLLEAGIVSGTPPRKGARWQIHISEIDKGLEFIKNIRIIRPDPSRFWTFDDVLRFKLAECESFAEFIQALRSGEIACGRFSLHRKRGFSAIMVDKLSLSRWQKRNCPGISLQALAVRLGVKQEVVYHLANAKLIPTISRGRLGLFVDLASVDSFESRYVWARDVAKAANTSSRNVIAVLRARGVSAVAGPDIDGCRQYLFLRNDIEDVNSLKECL